MTRCCVGHVSHVSGYTDGSRTKSVREIEPLQAPGAEKAVTRKNGVAIVNRHSRERIWGTVV